MIQELRKSKTKNLIGLVKKTDFDTKITKTGNKISDITDLVKKKMIMIKKYIIFVIQELQIKLIN